MANLKVDLVNKLNNDKFYEEMELIRLAQEPNMNYKEKIDSMQNRLEALVLINAQLGLVDQYFQDAPADGSPQQAPAPQQAPQPQAQPGQSHGE